MSACASSTSTSSESAYVARGLLRFKRPPVPSQYATLMGVLSMVQGAMMVGDERFCSLEQGCKPCPVCNSTVRA